MHNMGHQQYMHPGPHPQHPPPDLSMKGGTAEGRYYSLEIAQQPDRARMCGFGDKDRRPITPPPCIRLRIANSMTDEEIDYTQIDTHHYILQVDLWNADGTAAVNCVQHSNTSPSVSISMATTTSYPPQPEQHYMMHGMHNQYMHPGAPGYGQYGFAQSQMMPTGGPPSGNYTRNLIGSCSVSAYSLADLDDNVGLWFVLQDLSVRTEGSFRLRFSFINVGTLDGNLTTGTNPVLATAFSDVFTVWSAKKFPGVKESTELSKKFAVQGVKIPIRKDGGGKGGKGGDGELDEGDE